MNRNHQLQYNANSDMSLDKTFVTLTALRFKSSMETGSILDRKRSGSASIDGETVDAVRVTFYCSPRKSIGVAPNELAISRSTVHKVFHKQPWLHACKLQLIALAKQLLLKKF